MSGVYRCPVPGDGSADNVLIQTHVAGCHIKHQGKAMEWHVFFMFFPAVVLVLDNNGVPQTGGEGGAAADPAKCRPQ